MGLGPFPSSTNGQFLQTQQDPRLGLATLMFIPWFPKVESPRDLFCKGLAWGGALGKEVTCETVATPIYICCMFFLYKDKPSLFSTFSEGTGGLCSKFVLWGLKFGSNSLIFPFSLELFCNSKKMFFVNNNSVE